MKIYAICLTKNEDDVIGQSLVFATRYCEKIFVIDNGSTDATWDIVKTLAQQHPQIVAFSQTFERSTGALRWLAYEAHHQGLSDDDWWMILDSDEFLAEDPRPVIQKAMAEGASIIKAWQIQFYYTEKDHEVWLEGRDRRDRPIYQRRRYYCIDHQEPRLFRNQSRGSWKTAAMSRHLGMPPWLQKQETDGSWRTYGRTRAGTMSRWRIFNRHYQYRDPNQIEQRLKLRYGHPGFAAQVGSTDWRSKIRRSRELTYYKDGDSWHFSLSGLTHYYWRWLGYVLTSRVLRARQRLATLVRS